MKKPKDVTDYLKSRMQVKTDVQLAKLLGMTAPAFANWRNPKKQMTPLQIANCIVSARNTAIKDAFNSVVRPIVEFFPIKAVPHNHAKKTRDVLDGGKSAGQYIRELHSALSQESSGLYIFYDTRGKALYAGQTKRQNLWKEINLAFNRSRSAQTITLVTHPTINVSFKPANEQVRQPKDKELKLHDLAAYFSAYAVVPAMVDDLEALLIRAFPNDLLNAKKEKFGKAHKVVTKGTGAVR